MSWGSRPPHLTQEKGFSGPLHPLDSLSFLILLVMDTGADRASHPSVTLLTEVFLRPRMTTAETTVFSHS